MERKNRRMNELEDFAETYFSEYKGKSVPLDLLLAWLSENHDHREDETPFVHSMDLHRWAEKNAVTRVVDHGQHRGDSDVWHFFEHGWHKAGAACEGHLTQSRARLVKGPTPEGFAIFEVSGEVAAKMQEGMVSGVSIHEEPLRYRRTSSTTGREHWCELPPEETCYWSGDPYAPHEMGF
jgi:hypothetical protein